MKVEQVQVEVTDLTRGMYVCALDRPWLSTPFPFQGFVIRSEQEIAELKRYCNFVYVDVLRGLPPSPEGGRKVWRRDRIPGEATAEELLEAAGRESRVAVLPLSAVQQRAAAERQPAAAIKALPLKLHHDRYPPPRGLRRELRRALDVHRELGRSVGQMLDDIRVGRGLDAAAVRRASNRMVDSILRHPDALIWLGRLRERDGYSYAHSVRSAILAVVLGRHLGLAGPRMQRLAMGTLLCEIGKARLPRHLLEKKDPLSDDELERMQEHVRFGVELLGRCPGVDDEILEVVGTHHERYDGTGYPAGLHGDQIPLLGRIAGLIDCYDAMTTLKPYTPRVFSPAQALDYFYGQRDQQFQAQLVDEFIQAIGLYPTGTVVELSNGEVGVVLAQQSEQRLQPEVLVVLDAARCPVDPPRRVDLRDLNARSVGNPISIRRALLQDEHGLDPSRLLEAHVANRWDWRRLRLR